MKGSVNRIKNFVKAFWHLKISIAAILYFLCISLTPAQNLPPQVQNELEQYKNLINENMNNGDKAQAAQYMNKAAYLLWNNHALKDAVGYYLQALDISKQMGNKNGSMILEYNIGMLYSDMEDFSNALIHLKNGLRIARELNMKESVASGLTNVATAAYGKGEYKEAIKHLDEAAILATEMNNLKLLRRTYGLLYENYEALGLSKEAYKYFDLYSSFDKEIKDEEMKEVRTEAETKVNQAYAEKAQTEIEKAQTEAVLRQTEDSLKVVEELTREQRLEIELKEAKIRETEAREKATTQLLVLVVTILALVLISALLLLRQNRAIKAQKEEIQRQRDKLESQNQNIKSSIRYAKTIQQAILPDGEELNNKYFDSFILFWPKDIVSGDFYWYSHFKAGTGIPETYFIAVVDCTGHGVPGAFMSMIGNRLLNEIVNEKHIFSPAEILDELDREVRNALRQEQTDNNDGMDVCLCKLENIDGQIKCTYSGAKRPLYHFENETDKLNRLKGDRKSIGGVGAVKTINFTEQVIELKENDLLFLSSDGIIDQHGPDRKRFGSNRLEQEIISVKTFDPQKQQNHFEYTLKNYIQIEEQRDDITLMGIRIKPNNQII